MTNATPIHDLVSNSHSLSCTCFLHRIHHVLCILFSFILWFLFSNGEKYQFINWIRSNLLEDQKYQRGNFACMYVYVKQLGLGAYASLCVLIYI